MSDLHMDSQKRKRSYLYKVAKNEYIRMLFSHTPTYRQDWFIRFSM